MKKHMLLAMVATLLVSSCGKKEEPVANVTTPAPAPQQGMSAPVTPVPDRPAPDVAKGSAAEYPKPGQTNNHSSPDFKGGGTSADK